MPIYEYECKSCGHRFECIQKIHDSPLTQCPHCQKNTLEKCVSLPSFHLKGDGWYETDFKNKENCPKKENNHESSCCDTCQHNQAKNKDAKKEKSE